MTFETILDTIKNAIRGKDVRQAIYEGLDSINKQQTENLTAYENFTENINNKVNGKINNEDNVIKFNMMDNIIQNFYDFDNSECEEIELKWTNGEVYNTSGILTPYANGACSNIIDVIAGEIYKIKTYNVNWLAGFVILDDDGNLIEKSSNVSMEELIVTIPYNGKKLILSTAFQNMKSEYSCYRFTKLITSNIYSSDKFLESVISKIHSVGWDKLTSELQKSLLPIKDKTNQIIKPNYVLSDDLIETNIIGATYIKVDNIKVGEVYSVNYRYYRNNAIRIFDENDNIIYSTGTSSILVTDVYVTIPSNAAYMIIQGYTSGLSVGKIKGYTLTDFHSKTIICGGDSLTVGYNTVANNSYVDYLAEYYSDCTVKNNGGNGQDAAWLVNQLTNQQRNTRYPNVVDPDYSNVMAVIINIGTNGGVSGSIETSIPQLEKATDIEGNALSFMTVDNAISEGGFNYDGVNIATDDDYWSLFSNNWYGNLGLIIEYIQWKNSKTQIFLLPPCISTILANENTSAEKISEAMKELCNLYGIHFIDINNAIGINRRNAKRYCGDYVHGTNLRNEMVGKYVARYISDKIYDFDVEEN